MGFARIEWVIFCVLVACGGPEALERAPAVLTVSASDPAPRVGDRVELAAALTTTDGATRDVTDRVAWGFDATAWRPVGPSTFEALAAGRTVLTATYESLEATVELEVREAPIVELVVAPNRVEVRAGDEAMLSAFATFADGRSEDVSARATWSVDDASIASIENGRVVAHREGDATVEGALDGLVARASVVVLRATLEALTLTSTRTTFEVGQTIELTALAMYSDDSTSDVTASAGWAVRPATAARLEAGRLVALEVGSIEIEARFEGRTATLELEIVPAAVVAIELMGNAAPGAVGELRALRAEGTFRDGTGGDITQIATWSTDRPDVATVSSGIVRLVGVGEASIRASHDGVVTAPVDLRVGPARLLFLRLGGRSMPLGSLASLTVTGVYTDETERDVTAQLTWQSSVPSVATVSAGGALVTLAEGTTTVIATDPASGVSVNAQVTVTPPELLALSVVASATTIFVGASVQISVTGHFTDGDRDVTSEVTLWCAPQLVSIDGDAVATGVAPGTCEVHANHPTYGVQTSAGNGSATLIVVAVVPIALQITPIPPLPPGATASLSAVAHYNDGHVEDATDDVAWSVPDPQIGAVGQIGNARGQFIAQGVGATSLGGSAYGLTASEAVTVYDATIVSLAFTVPSVWIKIGQERQLEVVGTFSDGSTHPVTNTVSYSSGDVTIADVETVLGRSGIAHGVAVGQTSMVATAPNGVSTPPLPVVSDPGRVVVESSASTPTFSFMTGSATALTLDVPAVGGVPLVAITDVDVEIDFSFNFDTGTCHPPYGLGVLTPYLSLSVSKGATTVDLIELSDWDIINFTGAFTVLFDQSALNTAWFWVPFLSPLRPTNDSLDDFDQLDPTGTWTFTISNWTSVDTCLTHVRLIIEYDIP